MKSLYAYFSWYWLCNEDWVKCYCKDSFENYYDTCIGYINFMLQWICQLLLNGFQKNASVTSIMKGIKKSHTKAKYTLNLQIFSTWYHTSTHIHVYICNELNFCLQCFSYNIFGYMYVVLCLQHKSESAYHTILCINTILKCIP